MSSRASSRARAIAAAHGACPRCAAPREARHAYCLECGLQLPVVDDGFARFRRAWLQTVGWYPGDWIWLTLVAAVLAAAGAAAVLAINRHHAAAAATTLVAPTPRLTTTTSPAAAPNGHTVWPSNRDGWTVVLLSIPASKGPNGPLAAAHTAARRGLPQVGRLESSDFGSLHPGYTIVFSGIYGALADADTALASVHARGFGGAYVVRVTP